MAIKSWHYKRSAEISVNIFLSLPEWYKLLIKCIYLYLCVALEVDFQVNGSSMSLQIAQKRKNKIGDAVSQ